MHLKYMGTLLINAILQTHFFVNRWICRLWEFLKLNICFKNTIVKNWPVQILFRPTEGVEGLPRLTPVSSWVGGWEGTGGWVGVCCMCVGGGAGVLPGTRHHTEVRDTITNIDSRPITNRARLYSYSHCVSKRGTITMLPDVPTHSLSILGRFFLILLIIIDTCEA